MATSFSVGNLVLRSDKYEINSKVITWFTGDSFLNFVMISSASRIIVVIQRQASKDLSSQPLALI